MKKQNKTENETRETKFEENGAGMESCCSKMMAHCCEDVNEEAPEGMKAMMSKCSKCMKVFRWFPLIPVVLGSIIFLSGYLLDAEIVRMLWLIVSGSLVLLGFLALILIGSMCRT